ncbi:hypothetical protein A4S06_08355 [Erysipelotrichaceae bacterium MTC7]|nr:hypothetical protein A4S06_08355 [Erysipelotrichaceae bacterium MTC7]
MQLFRDLYQYRELLKSNVKKEIRGKYKGSFLGVLWSFINPLLQVLVYAIVFPWIMKDTVDNFLFFLVVGIIPWTFFITVMNQGVATVKSNAGIVKKVYFPREILPISVVVSGLVNFMISTIIIVIFALATGAGLSWHIVFLPIIMILQFLLSLGLVFALSAINVYIQDTEYIVSFILSMMFYGTPILYDASQFSGSQIGWIFKVNPLAMIIDEYRAIFYYHQVPDLTMMAILAVICITVCIIGYFIFKKLEKGFAEEI